MGAWPAVPKRSNRSRHSVQRPVHHHRCDAVADRRHAGRQVVAVVLVQADRDARVHLGQGLDHAAQHDVAGIGPGAALGLQDDRGVDAGGGLQDRQTLFHVVDVLGGNAIAMLGGVVQKLSQRNERHQSSPSMSFRARAAMASGVMPKWR